MTTYLQGAIAGRALAVDPTAEIDNDGRAKTWDKELIVWTDERTAFKPTHTFGSVQLLQKRIWVNYTDSPKLKYRGAGG